MAVQRKIVMSLGRAMSTQEMCNYNRTSENKRNDSARSPALTGLTLTATLYYEVMSLYFQTNLYSANILCIHIIYNIKVNEKTGHERQ